MPLVAQPLKVQYASLADVAHGAVPGPSGHGARRLNATLLTCNYWAGFAMHVSGRALPGGLGTRRSEVFLLCPPTLLLPLLFLLLPLFPSSSSSPILLPPATPP